MRRSYQFFLLRQAYLLRLRAFGAAAISDRVFNAICVVVRVRVVRETIAFGLSSRGPGGGNIDSSGGENGEGVRLGVVRGKRRAAKGLALY